MKKLIKYLSIIIVVIAISVTVYLSTSSNQTVEMWNKEALAEDPEIWIGQACINVLPTICHWVTPLGDLYDIGRFM